MNPYQAWNQGYSIVFPNNRSRDLWLERYLRHSSLKGVISSTKALTLSELLFLLCERQQPIKDKIFSDQELFYYHGFYLQNFYRQTGQRLDTARTLQAFTLCDQWLLDHEQLKNFAYLPLEKYFIEYRAFLSQQDKIPQTPLSLVRRFLENQEPLELPNKKLFIFGIDDLTPLQERLLQNLSCNNEVIFEQDSPIKPLGSSIEKYRFEQDNDELLFALKWLKEQPCDTLSAIVIPDLSQHYDLIVRLAQNFFSPQLSQAPLNHVANEFAISHGLKAYNYPLIAHTLLWLEGQLEDSPFFDKKIDQSSSTHSSPIHSSHLVESIFTTLEQSSWCLNITLSSSEYQTREFFIQTLKNAAAISSFTGKMLMSDFLKILKQLFNQLIFQPQSPSQPSKFILGLLEAAALPLDQVFMIHASENTLIKGMQPHPYINKQLAQHRVMPHSSWEREMGYLKKMMIRLFSNKKGFLSYAKTDCELGQHQSEASLFNEFLGSSYYQDRQFQSEAPHSFSKQRLKEDYRWESRDWSVSELNAYYHCPFKGFVQKLGLQPIEQNDFLPISPKNQGIFFHNYLQRKIENQPIQPLINEYLSHLPPALQQQEIEKSHRVFLKVTEDLDIDKFSSEVAWTLTCDNLRLRGRYDLYSEQLSQIFDFKSKNFNYSSWFSTHPTDLQGVLYILSKPSCHLGVIKADPHGADYKLVDCTSYQPQWLEIVQQTLENIHQFQTKPSPRTLSHCRSCSFHQSCRYHLLQEQD